MAYFLCTRNGKDLNDTDINRRQEWENVVNKQIKGDWRSQNIAGLEVLDHHLEAKALYICSMTYRFLRMVYKNGGDSSEKWHSVYIENYVLIFPVIELLGKAVFQDPKYGSPHKYLVAGLYLLNNPSKLPSLRHELLIAQKDSKEIERETTPITSLKGVTTQPRINHIVRMRDYLLHGISGRPKGQGAMSYQHPWAIAKQIEITIREYWKQLCIDEGEAGGWVDRLAQAAIYPFPILGSKSARENFEHCFIIPGIVEYLADPKRSLFSENRH